MVSSRVRSLRGEPLNLRHGGVSQTVQLSAGQSVVWDANARRWTQ